MTTINISLPVSLKDWVESRVENGSYLDESDYLRDLIRQDQIEFRDREALVGALVAGENSGTSEHQITDIVTAWRMEREGRNE